MTPTNHLRPLGGRALQSIHAPALRLPRRTPPASFSTSAPRCKKTGDRSRNRGVSSIHRSGPRQMLSVSNEELPRPADHKPKIVVSPSHGLWGFFPKPDTLMNTPEQDGEHGRAWMASELRKKRWEDLHALWWVCVKERNRLATAEAERARAKMGFGDAEANARDDEIKKTMRAIKHVLTERFYTWQDARELAKKDPELDLSGRGPVYAPGEPYKYVESAEDVGNLELGPLETQGKTAELSGQQLADVDRAGEKVGDASVGKAISPP